MKRDKATDFIDKLESMPLDSDPTTWATDDLHQEYSQEEQKFEGVIPMATATGMLLLPGPNGLLLWIVDFGNGETIGFSTTAEIAQEAIKIIKNLPSETK